MIKINFKNYQLKTFNYFKRELFINHLIVFKSKENIHCISAACPHLGISLTDGFLEKDKVICPGYGIAFSMENGMPSCKKFKTASYKVTTTKDKFLIS